MLTVVTLLPPRLAENADKMRRLGQPLAIADVLGQEILKRVRFDGRPADPREGRPKWRSAKGSYWQAAGITAGFQARVRKQRPTDAESLPRRKGGYWALYAADIKLAKKSYIVRDPYSSAGRAPSTYALTGSMWAGLYVTTSGSAARIRFARRAAPGRAGDKVTPETRAMSIFRRTGDQVIRPLNSEITAAAAALGIALSRLSREALGAEDVGAGPGVDVGAQGGATYLVRAIAERLLLQEVD